MTPEERAALVARCRAVLGCLEQHEGVPRGECAGTAQVALILVMMWRGQTPAIAEFKVRLEQLARSGARGVEPLATDFARCLRRVTPRVSALLWIVWGEARGLQGVDDDMVFVALRDALDEAAVGVAVDALLADDAL